MFGHDWEHGTAKVIDKSLMPSGSATSSVPGRYRYVVDVQDPTGEPFRGEIQDSKFRVEGYVVSQLAAAPGTAPEQPSPGSRSGGPTININVKVFKGPMDKAELQKLLAESGKSPDQGA